MMISAQRFGSTVTLALALAMGAIAPAAGAATLYDDFSATILNPAKWAGEEVSLYGATLVEARRAILSGVVRIEAKGYSDKFSNTGTGRVSNRLLLGTSETVTDLKATVTPRTALFTTCAGNTSAGEVQMGLRGGFFNAGQAPSAGRYNDVWAAIEIYRQSNSSDASGVFRVSGNVFQCTDSECFSSRSLGSVDLGTTTLNTATDLHVTWNQSGHNFAFQKDAEGVQSVVYTVSDTNPARDGEKRLDVTDDIANCTATRVYSYGGADFDNVYTN